MIAVESAHLTVYNTIIRIQFGQIGLSEENRRIGVGPVDSHVGSILAGRHDNIA